MLTRPKYFDELLSPGPKFRVNLSSYSSPLVAPLRIFGMGLAVMLVLAIVWDGVELWGLQQEVRELTESSARLQDQDRRVVAEATSEGHELSEAAGKRLPSDVAFVNRLVEKRMFSWTQFLSELEQAVPTGVGVLSIRLDPNSAVIQLAGAAHAFEDVTAFVTVLQNHPHFYDPVLTQHQNREDGLVEFHVRLHYRNYVKPS